MGLCHPEKASKWFYYQSNINQSRNKCFINHESCVTYEDRCSELRMNMDRISIQVMFVRHITRVHKSCHTGTSQISHITRSNKSCHSVKSVISHVNKSYIYVYTYIFVCIHHTGHVNTSYRIQVISIRCIARAYQLFSWLMFKLLLLPHEKWSSSFAGSSIFSIYTCMNRVSHINEAYHTCWISHVTCTCII